MVWNVMECLKCNGVPHSWGSVLSNYRKITWRHAHLVSAAVADFKHLHAFHPSITQSPIKSSQWLPPDKGGDSTRNRRQITRKTPPSPGDLLQFLTRADEFHGILNRRILQDVNVGEGSERCTVTVGKTLGKRRFCQRRGVASWNETSPELDWCITSVLHLYYICIASVLHLYYICITSVLHLYYICITSVLHLYYICYWMGSMGSKNFESWGTPGPKWLSPRCQQPGVRIP